MRGMIIYNYLKKRSNTCYLISHPIAHRNEIKCGLMLLFSVGFSSYCSMFGVCFFLFLLCYEQVIELRHKDTIYTHNKVTITLSFPSNNLCLTALTFLCLVHFFWLPIYKTDHNY